MSWLYQKYIGILSPRLLKFKRKSGNLYNFRCPLCGDSETHKNKARGYIYQKEGKMMFHCHNCNATMGIPNFIKMMDVNLYNEFMLEKLQDSKAADKKEDAFQSMIEKMKRPVFMTGGPLKGLKKISQLSADNPIKIFIADRKIPNPYHAKLFYCPNFKNYVNTILPGKFEKDSLLRDETRILIPYLNVNKEVIAMNFRSIAKNSPVKYIKILINENFPNIYGMDTVNLDKKTYITEGEFDSMFLSNAIATGGGDLVSAVRSLPKENLVVVYDNEPRSKETAQKIQKAIYAGYSVCIWPQNFEHKDVNDAVKEGLTSEFIQYIIDQNTYKDLAAKLALQNWSKA